MNKKIISYAILPVLGLSLVVSGGAAMAASKSVDHSKPMDALVTAISTKFHLNSAEVQAVVDQAMNEQRTKLEADQAKNFAARLATAVSEKKLTQAQADLITAKQAELKASRTSLEGKAPEERMTAMKEQMASLKKWASDNKIPQGFMMFGAPMGRMDKGHDGPRGPHGFEMKMKKPASAEAAK